MLRLGFLRRQPAESLRVVNGGVSGEDWGRWLRRLGEGSIEGYLTVRNASSQAFTTSTLADVSALTFPVEAKPYRFEFVVPYQSSATTCGAKVGLTAPAGSIAATVRIGGYAAAGADAEWVGFITASGGSVTATDCLATSTVYLIEVSGWVYPTAAGNVQLQMATETASGNTITVSNGATGVLIACD